jgi:hypothetical protein
MATMDPYQIANVWLANGGARNRLVGAVSVALAASGGNPEMSTVDGRYGLWGITDKVARKAQVPTADLLDPDAATRLAILLSGNGTNWGLWSVAWAPDATPSRSAQVLWPQPGSVAWQQLPVAQVTVGNWDGVDYADTYGDALNDFGYAWNTLSWVMTTWMASAYSSIGDTAYLAEGLQRT